jgi:pseudaminic acid biosynthesis-associated methylase
MSGGTVTSQDNGPTEQEAFWSGAFGEAYSKRNVGDHWVAANTVLFADVLAHAEVSSVLEIGANIGLNVRALQNLIPDSEIAGVEINDFAAEELEKTGCTVFRGSALDFTPPRRYDLVFTKGVLIHMPPERLPEVYDLMYGATERYLLVAEYYNPRPETITYHGQEQRLFRRDFAGEILDRFPDVRLVRTGFAYHRGPFPQDDLTWFLMEKQT